MGASLLPMRFIVSNNRQFEIFDKATIYVISLNHTHGLKQAATSLPLLILVDKN